MIEEKKPIEETTEMKVTPEAAYDPEYKAYLQKQKTAKRLDEMVEKDPGFKEILDTKIGDKSFRDEIFEKPRILEDDELFVSKTQNYSFAKMKQLKTVSEAGTPPKVEMPPVVNTDEPPANRDAAGDGGKNKPSLQDLTPAELKAKGYSDRDVEMIKNFL